MSETRSRRLESAAQHMVSRVPRAHPEDTASAVFARLRGQAFDYAGAVFLVAAGEKFAGSVLATLVVARFEAALQAQVTIAFFVPAIVYFVFHRSLVTGMIMASRTGAPAEWLAPRTVPPPPTSSAR